MYTDRSKIANKYVVIATTTATIIVCGSCCIYNLILWRARKRSRTIVKQIVDSIQEDGPLIDYTDPSIRDRIIITSMKRASKWMTLSKHQIVHPMIGQVGGLGRNRKPMLTLLPEYICKPLLLDHRGLREITFYEAIRTVTQSQSHHVRFQYCKFLTGREPLQPQQSVNVETSATTITTISSYRRSLTSIRRIITSALQSIVESIDTISMALAVSKYIQDTYVLQSEQILHQTWQDLQLEIDQMRQLNKFTAPYYGVILIPATSSPLTGIKEAAATTTSNEQSLLDQNHQLPEQLPSDFLQSQYSNMVTSDISPFISDTKPTTSTNHYWEQLQDSHLLLQDLTINYSKPCVMDLKMGVQTYEPDSSPEKREREYGKYPQQKQFGFRIVGMRFYDPTHSDADVKGYRYFEKSFGRSLTTRDELMDAFQLYFSGGCVQPPQTTANSEHQTANTNGDSPSKQSSSLATSSRIRRRTISNILVQLRPIRRWFEENKSLRFYASSLLIIYEGDVANSPNPDMTTVKMIDFGRVRREKGGDQGYSTGLSTVKNIFADLLIDDEQMSDVSKNYEIVER